MTDSNVWVHNFMTKWQETPESVRNDYGPTGCDYHHEQIKHIMETANPNCNQVMDAIIDAITNVNPQLEYVVGGTLEIILAFIQSILPIEILTITFDNVILLKFLSLLKRKNKID